MSGDIAAAIRGATRAMEGWNAATKEHLPPFPPKNAVAYLAFSRADRKAHERAASQRQAISEAMQRHHRSRQDAP